MSQRRICPLIILLLATTTMFGGQLHADTVDRQNCLASEIAENRGFEAMEGLKFMGEDGKPYSMGNFTVVPPIDPIFLNDPKIIELADKWTPGAIEYIDGWVIGYQAIGRDNKKVATKAAKEFISFYLKCLEKFGPAGWR